MRLKLDKNLIICLGLIFTVLVIFFWDAGLAGAAEDTTPPGIILAEAVYKDKVYVLFNEKVDVSTASYSIDGSPFSSINGSSLQSDQRVVMLSTPAQTPGASYTLTINNLKDLASPANSTNVSTTYKTFTPHGMYNTETNLCAECHVTHTASNVKLLPEPSEKQTCYLCHIANGQSNFNVDPEFQRTYTHPLRDANKSYLDCSDCHNPHGDIKDGNSIWPKLLRSSDSAGNKYVTGNDFCLACHGMFDRGVFGSYYADTAGNHKNANAVHYDTSYSILVPGSGTNITCISCHENHGSQNSWLLDNSINGNEEGQCFKCHGDTTANNMESGQAVKLNVYRQFNMASAPAAPTLSYTTTGGSLLGDTTYYFKATAYSSTTGWESAPGPEASIDVPAGTNTNKITVTIPQYTGATVGFDKFKIYMSYRATAPSTFTLARTASDGSLTAGTYYVIVTSFGPFGETKPSTRKSIAISANDSLSITVPNYPNVAGYPTANYFKLFISKTSGSETLQDTVFNNKTKKMRTNLVTGGESVPTFTGSNNLETYQATVTANLVGNTVYNQTLAPVTTYPVPKGSKHEIDPTDPSRAGSKIECSSCHGPHTVDNVKYSANQATSAVSDPLNTKKYWVQSGTSDATKTVGTMADWCLRCHSGTGNVTQTTSSTVRVPFTMGWPNIDFSNNNSGWFKDTVWPNSKHKLAGYQCTNCHDPHGTREHLILKYPYDGFDYNGNCLRCHDGSTPPAKNIKAEFQKTARHPVLDSGFGGHEIDENYQYSGTGTPNRHAECEDCHDPHSADNTVATAPNAMGSIKNVTGVGFTATDATSRPAWTSLAYNSPIYSFKRPLTYEYELCYKCHSSYAFGTKYPTSTSGAIETDVAMQFNRNNLSFHPVEVAGKNTTIPAASFVNGWNAAKLMYCFDCHGDNAKTIRGPHGSTNKYMLKDPYDSGEYTGTVQNTLCLSCHNPTVYAGSSTTASGSQFVSGTTNLHNKHRNDYYTSYGGSGSWFCGDCHGLYVHGQKRPNLIAYSTDAYPYGKWSAITKWKDPGTYGGSYGETSCTTTKKPGTNSNCYGGHSGTSPFNP